MKFTQKDPLIEVSPVRKANRIITDYKSTVHLLSKIKLFSEHRLVREIILIFLFEQWKLEKKSEQNFKINRFNRNQTTL